MFLQPPEELIGPNWSTKCTPSFWDAYRDRGVADEQAESEPSYVVQARTAVESYPDSPIALARLAQATQAAGDAGGAIDLARRAMHAGLEEHAIGAVHAAMTILAQHGEASAGALLIDDERASNVPIGVRVRAAAAAREFDAAQRMPGAEESADALAVIAWIKTEQGQYPEAVAAARKAERAGAAGVTLYANLGYAHAALGNLDKAIKATRQAHALSPRDRDVAFSLARYLRLAGRHDEGMHVLAQLKDGGHVDIELALAMAHAATDAGAPSDALRVLQRTRASQEWATADKVLRAELTANLALLRWITQRDRADSSLREILRALRECDYQSIGVANLLLNLMRTPDHAEELAKVLGRLETRHSEEALAALRMLLAILRRDHAAAVRHAVTWSEIEIFNPFAASTATLLVGEVAGDYEKAAAIALETLRRAPLDVMLLNNAAFVLAMSGKLRRAQELLDRAQGDVSAAVYLSATQGLIDLLGGRTSEGRDGYRRAARIARERGDEELATRVELYASFAEAAADADRTFGDPSVLMCDKRLDPWREGPMFWIAGERLRREASEAAASVAD